MDRKNLRIELAVFALVTAAFTNIYITQPILPVLEAEFGVSTVQVSFTVSLVILGIVLSNLFFGVLSDRVAIHPILGIGGLAVGSAGLVCAFSREFTTLAAARLIQGLFLPALTTSLAAWLAKNLPREKLTVVMGSYVAATVLGGLGGRLLGGWIHPPLDWRYAFVSASVFIFAASVFAISNLPKAAPSFKPPAGTAGQGFQIREIWAMACRWDLLRLYCCGAAGLLMFSPVFNYLPYRLSGPPFYFTTEMITLVYLVYVLGIFIGPFAGRVSLAMGGGNTMLLGCLLLGAAFGLLLIPALWAVIIGLLMICAGFFTIHATAVGLLNQKLDHGQGQANALYVLFYYTGGWLGITAAGIAQEIFGWNGVVLGVAVFVLVPLLTGLAERKDG